jgi:hypothetical protein
MFANRPANPYITSQSNLNRMRRSTLLLRLTVFLLAISAVGINSCSNCTQSFLIMKPIYKSHQELKQAVEVQSAQPLENPGKIYLHNNYIFINERNEGFHIVDNRNPNAPRKLAFVKVPGNIDIAAQGNALYADSYTDMMIFDISNPAEIQLKHQVENVFPDSAKLLGPQYVANDNKGIVIGYEREVKTMNQNCTGGGGNAGMGFDDDVIVEPVGGGNNGGNVDLASSQSNAGTEGTRNYLPGASKGGSFARFATVGDYLYTLTLGELKPFSIQEPFRPQAKQQLDLDMDVETLFPYEDHLFVGSRTGMEIYNIEDPTAPRYVSEFRHAFGCDPVVVRDDYAYVTVHSATSCGRFTETNQLDVIDVSDMDNPTLKKSYQMQNPKGVGVNRDKLVLCEGEHGMKVFSRKDPINLTLKAHKKDMEAYDVIPYGDLAFVVGQSGFYQFDITNASSPQQISHIPVK